MSTEPDVASEDDRPGPVLAGQFLHQRVAFRNPRPGGRIDGLEVLEAAGDVDANSPDHSEEHDAG